MDPTDFPGPSDVQDQEEPLPKRPRSSQASHHPGAEAEDPMIEELAELAGMGALEGDAAREEALTSEHLLNLVFSHLSLEDLCRAAMVRRRWNEVTSNPEFWKTINLKGRTLMVSKVRALLSRHTGVRFLNARGVAFTQADLVALLPALNQLESLELEKGAYERSELEALGAHLPALTRLVLAGGLLGPQMSQEPATLAHPHLQSLALEGGRAARLRIQAPQLTSLSLHDFTAASIQLHEAGQLASVAVSECSKLTDGALRGLLCLEGPAATALPSLTHLSLAAVPNASDDTMRLLGQRHPALASLSLNGCGALTGAGLAVAGSFAALRTLSVEFCDSLTGNNLSDAVHELHGLEELRVTGCTQVTSLRLQSSRLARLALCGTRALQELDLRCARLAAVDITPLNPGLAASLALKRILLASHAVERLQWSAFPALETVRLQCPNLQELDLSECHALKDSVFESLGSGARGGPGGYVAGDPLNQGCPQLRVVKLGDCEALRNAALSSQTLESLQLSQCCWLHSVQLDCPVLTQLALEECTHLEEVRLQSRRMQGMSLGTCPRLARITINCDSMQQLDLRGCNQLDSLQLNCPKLRSIDATFCKSLSDAAIQSMARCGALEELVLAACDSVTISGLGALSQLSQLRKLDLSYTPLEDPTPIYRACCQLTSLTLSNNYALRPDALLPLLPPAAEEGEGEAEDGGCSSGRDGGGGGTSMVEEEGEGEAEDGGCSSGRDGGGGGTSMVEPAAGARQQLPHQLLPDLRVLDIGYCAVPADVLAAVVRRAARLRSLSINGCRGGVTDALWPLLHCRATDAAAAAAAAALGMPPSTPGPTRAPPAFNTAVAPVASNAACTPSESTSLPAAPAAAASTSAAAPAAASAAAAAAPSGASVAPTAAARACASSGPPMQSLSQPPSQLPAPPACPGMHHELRSLSMVGSKELRNFCLGLMPATVALQHGLLISGGTVMVGPEGGQQWVPVDSVLAGLQELRMSLSARLRGLALGLPELTDLQLNNCGELAALMLHCPRLERLSLQACRALPEAVLVAAVERCPMLRELDLQYCPVTAATVAALHAACPSLHAIHTTPPRAASP